MIPIAIGMFTAVAVLCLNLLEPAIRRRLVHRVEGMFGQIGGWLGRVIGRVGTIGPAQFAVVAGLGLIASAFFLELPALLAIGLAAVVFVLFSAAWYREFRFLMQLADADLPGRFDKPIWAALLIFLPPIGVLAFGAFRRSTWPEAKPAMAGDLA